MPVKTIPEGYHSVTPYLTVAGVPKLIDFLKQTFGATELHRMARPDGTVLHAEVTVGDSRIMMGEPVGEFQAMPAQMYVYVPDVDAAFKRALAAGAISVSEPADQFYGDRHGGVRDSCGNLWWIATHTEDVSPEEMSKRAEAAMKQRHGA
jgi:uncharacterized glyoxalase superfamily protein PhnB